MATTIETPSAERLETAERHNRWLVVTIIVLAVMLVALGAWVVYGLTSESETAASGEINALYDDYVATWMEQDSEAFVDLTTADYTFTSFGTSDARSERAATIAGLGEFQMERIGDLVVMGEGPHYFIAAAEQITYGGPDFTGISAYHVLETEEGLKIAGHTWVGNL